LVAEQNLPSLAFSYSFAHRRRVHRPSVISSGAGYPRPPRYQPTEESDRRGRSFTRKTAHRAVVGKSWERRGAWFGFRPAAIAREDSSTGQRVAKTCDACDSHISDNAFRSRRCGSMYRSPESEKSAESYLRRQHSRCGGSQYRSHPDRRFAASCPSSAVRAGDWWEVGASIASAHPVSAKTGRSTPIRSPVRRFTGSRLHPVSRRSVLLRPSRMRGI